jgi:hypothetical protein
MVAACLVCSVPFVAFCSHRGRSIGAAIEVHRILSWRPRLDDVRQWDEVHGVHRLGNSSSI